MTNDRNRLFVVRFDGDARPLDPIAEADRRIAAEDLCETGSFEVVGRDRGPYSLTLSTVGSKLALHIATTDETPLISHFFSFTPLRRAIRDYLAICQIHYSVAASADPYRLESIDMARRAIHNEGSEILRERLASKVIVDLNTARRLFTIVVASQWLVSTPRFE